MHLRGFWGEGILQQDQTTSPKITQHENFGSWYANNVQFFQNDFDLRMIFGEIEWFSY